MNQFIDWVQANERKFKRLEDVFQPFLNIALIEPDLRLLKTKEEIHQYLYINAYSEEAIESFYRVWYCYEKDTQQKSV